jgi:ABC-type sugar transport system ATPase subunit
MIYISHVLGDVMRLANSVAVLRDGALVTQGPIAEFNIPTMIRLMIGRDLKQLFPERTGSLSTNRCSRSPAFPSRASSRT